MADELQRQANRLRRSYNPQPGPGLNGGLTQSLTEPQQLDRLLSGMGQVIETASSELQRRENQPGTLIGMGMPGPNQVERNRLLLRMSDSNGGRIVRPVGRRRGNNDKVSPSGMRGTRNHVNIGRPRGS